MSQASRVPVLMYHRVGESHNAWEARYAIGAGAFAAHMRALAAAGYRPVGIDRFVAWLDGSASLPEGAFLLTFDDGFRGVREHALPVLESLEWPCAIFLVSDQIGGQDVWTRETNPSGQVYPLLDAAEIEDMRARGCSFHSHGRSHKRLPELDDAALADQLAGSRQALSGLLGEEVACLAYPYGAHDERVIAATRAAGYRAAFSTRSGFNQRDTDRYGIRRIDVYGTDTPRMLLRKVALGSNDGGLGPMLRYYARRMLRLA